MKDSSQLDEFLSVYIRIFIIKMIFYKNLLRDILYLLLYKFCGICVYEISFESFYKELSDHGKNVLNVPFRRKLFKILFEDLRNSKELSYSGWYSIKTEFQRAIENKGNIEKAVEDDPTLLDVKIKDPVFLVTLPRTGSTFLHTLLAEDKRWKAPEFWEMTKTIPFPRDPLSEDNKEYIKQLDNSLDINKKFSNSKGLISSHNMKASDPEGFLPFLKAEGIFGILSIILKLPKYTKQLQSFSHDDYIDIYKSLERNFKVLGRYQNIENRRYLLNQHFGPSTNIPALLEVFPDAKIITIHRDIKKIVPSMASLYSYIAIKYQNYRLSAIQLICDNLVDRYLDTLDKIVQVRQEYSTKKQFANSFIDIHFKDLLDNPEEVVKYIYKKSNMKYTKECEEKFTVSIYEKGKQKQNPHKYEKMVLNVEKIRQKSFRYNKKFNLIAN
ncbi:unnamed protein product [Dimorphilus gyrociliatus]|uniref:Uncharacterized protein n=1 Tax=Dimorphilus gyrociliatus TaxID=2664684 RepID=A0A7I8VBA6_9ANNE|nr:unnamed protein product [Dimorphilus gyrociliatus]